MMMIEITEQKKQKLSEHIENALHEMGKAMACVEQFGGEYGHRGGYGSRYEDMSERGRYGSRGGYMGYRDEEEWDDDDMGERRGRGRRRDSMGRYR